MKTRASYLATFRFGVATVAMVLWAGSAGILPSAEAATEQTADDQGMVDCMLPGQIQRLSNNVMIMGARHPIRTTRTDCHVRGGEYHDADHAAVLGHADVDRPDTVHHASKTHRKAHHAAKPVNSTSTK